MATLKPCSVNQIFRPTDEMCISLTLLLINRFITNLIDNLLQRIGCSTKLQKGMFGDVVSRRVLRTKLSVLVSLRDKLVPKVLCRGMLCRNLDYGFVLTNVKTVNSSLSRARLLSYISDVKMVTLFMVRLRLGLLFRWPSCTTLQQNPTKASVSNI